ncbi:MAG: DUF4254 domain-containing protein [Azonexus sp.]|jgi:hypothetical protein
MIKSSQVTAFHQHCLAEPDWPEREAALPAGEHKVWEWILANHRYNSLLWAEEDLARRRAVPDSEIAANKRAIDGFNQARNDAAERIDEEILVGLGNVDRSPSARQHSETAGMMVDRLSIMSLKIRAMGAQADRVEAGPEHREACRLKLERLREQCADLAACLDDLLEDMAAGRRYFKIYRQFKMYNDPTLNPFLYGSKA